MSNTTQPQLTLTAADMPHEIWGLWLPHLGEWLTEADAHLCFFCEHDALQYIADEIGGGMWDEGDLQAVLLMRRGS